ncbi:cobalt ECF transporter T component CbiQ [Anaerostipes sp.]|uniref:cobalt ECF transporter T component CbiQ n=1 Tax=Anaerostipes sp. TaxID=1872530 RepID=UPI0025B7C816|nr:cobalt ECF transporter T component CbiQ [Anaerostipes sp.]MBS7009245.1 cobalt ECF transporter T component CbiQ [Anaerostipes sp.]
MGRINEAVHEIHHLDAMASGSSQINRIHPLCKLLVTVWYIAVTMSFETYDLTGTLSMVLYPMIMMTAVGLSVRKSLKKLGPVLLLVCAVGIANPFFDRSVLFHLGTVPVTGGMVSMATLMMKGVFAVLASYLLILTTSMESICYAMRLLHIPKMVVTMVMLIYRYIIVLLKEAERISQAYAMRAPDQKGIHYRAWGTLLGQLLLRSIDRAQTVYESMTLRGFDGSFYAAGKRKADAKSIIFLAGWAGLIAVLRYVPVFGLAGKIFR